MDIAALASELATDPLTRGYSGMTDVEAAASLNTADRTTNKASMTASEVYNAIDVTEWSALTDTQREEIWNILHLGTINPFGLESDRFTTIFPSPGDTLTALAAARKNDVSRAVEIGFGVVKVGHVQNARI